MLHCQQSSKNLCQFRHALIFYSSMTLLNLIWTLAKLSYGPDSTRNLPAANFYFVITAILSSSSFACTVSSTVRSYCTAARQRLKNNVSLRSKGAKKKIGHASILLLAKVNYGMHHLGEDQLVKAVFGDED